MWYLHPCRNIGSRHSGATLLRSTGSRTLHTPLSCTPFSHSNEAEHPLASNQFGTLNHFTLLPQRLMKSLVALAFVLFVLAALSTPALAQSDTYDDVLLIVNDSSSASTDIGDYFSSRRNIPAGHICHLNVDTSEVIDSLGFKRIQWSIQNFMRSNNLIDSINYIVTTKGCPLRITTVQQDVFGLPAPIFAIYGGLGSFEDMLVVINGPDSTDILAPKNNNSITWNARFFGSTSRFARSASMPIYLVTRLDGYTVEDVKSLIRRAENPAAAGDGVYVFDKAANRDFWYNGSYYESIYNQVMSTADSLVRWHGDSSYVSSIPSEYLHGFNNVIGYVSWGSNDDASGGQNGAIPGNSWLNGAIAETYVSTGARSFQPGTGGGQSLIADWVAEGVSAIKGYTDEPTTGSIAYPEILFDRYRTRGWNMAESYYAASQYYIWRQVIIGDPKMKLSTSVISYPGVVDLGQGPRYAPLRDTISVRNVSGGSVDVASITIDGAEAADVSATPGQTLPYTINSGDSLRIVVSMIPTVYGDENATLHVRYKPTSQVDYRTADIDINGTGLRPVLNAPTALSMVVPVGQNRVSGTIRLSNQTMTDTVFVSALDLQDAGASWFTVDPSIRFPIVLLGGAATDVAVSYTPFGARNDSASLNIASNAQQSPKKVALDGTLLHRISIDLGQGYRYEAMLDTIWLPNYSRSPLSLSSVSFTGPNSDDIDATLLNGSSFPYNLASNDSVGIVVSMTPTTYANEGAVVNLAYKRPGDPLPSSREIAMIGRGLRPILNVPAQVTVTAPATADSATVTVRVHNRTAVDTVYVSALDLQGNGASWFTVDQSISFPHAIPGGGDWDITLSYNPFGSRRDSALLKVLSSASVSDQDVQVVGSSTRYVGIDLGAGPRYSPLQDTVWLTNSSRSPLNLTSTFNTGANAGDVSARLVNGATLPYLLAVRDSVGIIVTIMPTTYANEDAVVNLAYSRPGDPVVSSRGIAVLGRGTRPVLDVPATGLTINVPASADSATGTLTVRNRTATDTVYVTGLDLQGSGASWFTVDPSISLPHAIPGGQVWNIPVSYNPFGARGDTALLKVVSTATQPQQDVRLIGTSIRYIGIDLGAGSRYSPLQDTVWLTNSSRSPLNLTSVANTGANAADVTTTLVGGAGFPYTLAPRGSVGLLITMNPSTYATEDATVNLRYKRPGDASTSSRDIVVTGRGTRPVLDVPPGLTINIPASGDSATGTLTVRNRTATDTVYVTALDLQGSGASWFTVDPSIRFPIAIPGGRDLTIPVSYNPFGARIDTALLKVVSTATVPEQNVRVIGSSVRSIAVDLGSAPRYTPLRDTVWLTNSSRSPLSLTSVANTGANAADVTTTLVGGAAFPYSVATRGSVGIIITMNPSTYASEAATVNLRYKRLGDASTSSREIVVTGRGTRPVLDVPPGLTINIPASGDSATGTLKLRNRAAVDTVYVTALELQGSGASWFTVDPSIRFPIAIPGGKDRDISVRYNPFGARIDSALLKVVSTATVPEQNVPLVGTSVRRVAIDLGEGPRYAPLLDTIWLANSSSAPLDIASVVSTGANGGDFKVTLAGGKQFPYQLAAHTSLGVVVAMKPTVYGPENATLRLNYKRSGDPSLSSREIEATGKGVRPEIKVPGRVTIQVQQGAENGRGKLSLQNLTVTDTVFVTKLDITGPGSGWFAVDPSTKWPVAIPGGEIVDLEISYNPFATHTDSAVIKVSSSARQPEQLVVVEGNAWKRRSVDLGQGPRYKPLTDTMWVTNGSRTDIEIGGTTLGGTDAKDFEAMVLGYNGYSQILQPGERLGVVVTLLPTSFELESAELHLQYRTPGESQFSLLDADVSGAGLRPNSLPSLSAPAEIALGDGPRHLRLADTMWVRNNSNLPLSLRKPEVVGKDSVDFSAMLLKGSSFPKTIGPRDSVGFVVSLVPSRFGTQKAGLVIPYEYEGQNSSLEIALSGRGTRSTLQVPVKVVVKRSEGGEVVTGIVRLKNLSGSDTVTISKVVLSGQGAAMFSIAPSYSQPFIIPEGSFVDIPFTYGQTSGDEAHATLEIHSDAEQAVYAVQLLGTSSESVSGVDPMVTGERSSEDLLMISPNPFSFTTEVRYHLAVDRANVRVDMLDMVGRTVSTVGYDVEGAGEHMATVDGRELASGSYICRLTVTTASGSSTLTKTVIVAR